MLNLPEDADIGQEIDKAMDLIEEENLELKDILPRGYTKFSNAMLVALLKAFSKISDDIEGDVFGKIYEYFLGFIEIIQICYEKYFNLNFSTEVNFFFWSNYVSNKNNEKPK